MAITLSIYVKNIRREKKKENVSLQWPGNKLTTPTIARAYFAIAGTNFAMCLRKMAVKIRSPPRILKTYQSWVSRRL